MNRPARTRIKICGVRDTATATCAINAGADALGFVFHPPSPRFIEPSNAWEIIRSLPPFVTTVGLTVDLSIEAFGELEQICPTDYSQLHGNESIDLAVQCGPRLIKAVQFHADSIAETLSQWNEVAEVDAILVDGSAGGMGAAFDWSALAAPMQSIQKPIILAGGLTPENVGDAIRAVQPFAVDVSSGIESARGVKDHDLIRAFCSAVRGADAERSD